MRKSFAIFIVVTFFTSCIVSEPEPELFTRHIIANRTNFDVRIISYSVSRPEDTLSDLFVKKGEDWKQEDILSHFLRPKGIGGSEIKVIYNDSIFITHIKSFDPKLDSVPNNITFDHNWVLTQDEEDERTYQYTFYTEDYERAKKIRGY